MNFYHTKFECLIEGWGYKIYWVRIIILYKKNGKQEENNISQNYFLRKNSIIELI